MNITLEIDGQEQFNWAVDSISKSITDWRGVWPEVEQIFYRAQLEQFNSEGSRGGSRWTPLSDNYRNWKQKKYPGRPILVLTGRLKRSLTVNGAGGADQVRDQQPMSLTLGSVVPYAIYHQRGTKRMAQRQPMQFLQRDMGRITSRMYRFAERGARDAGFKTQSRSFSTPGAE